MKQKYDCIIGIDPGTNTGIAVWRTDKQCLCSVETMGITEAMDKVRLINHEHRGELSILVRIENPNLRKWFGKSGREVLQGAGSIKRDFAIWVEFFGRNGIPYEEVAPRNIKTKVSAEYFKKLTGWEGRTSSHARDAAMMVFKYQ